MQVNGLAMGAPTSGFTADIYMDALESRALPSFANPPETWLRYVDDTIAQMDEMILAFKAHFNSLDERVQVTHEVMVNNLSLIHI